MLYRSLRPALFRLSAKDPEGAHERVIDLLAAVSRSSRLTAGMRALYPPVESPRLRRRVFGLTFPNPIGLAAGFDKNAVALAALAALGFGFIEAGTVTYHAQPGNPRPRIVRLPEQQALVNRMGFNNDGAAAIAGRLAQGSRPLVPVGISLGKSRVTSLERAVEDYRASYRLLAPHADYIAVNVSSPNTPNLRSLQEREQVDALLTALQSEAAAIAEQTARPHPPLLVKVAPDLTDEALEELLGVCLARRVDGVIAVNTTVNLTRFATLTAPPSLARKGVPRQMVREQ
ncbi:MAG: quinone-dependent dihydroorotate dehydrogenase, partial [Dehalococcoidia bacterium]